MFSILEKARGRKRPWCTALVAAAGESRRMNGVNKLLIPLDGVPVLMYTLGALQLARRVDEIIVAARETDLMEISQLCKDYEITKCSKVVIGGKSRVHSVMLAAMEANRNAALFAVHDGARPLARAELIDYVINTAAHTSAAAPAIPVKDTIKIIKKPETGDRTEIVEQTLDRSLLRAIQTPQVFDADLLKAALQSALEDNADITDDCSAVERLGKVVYLLDGDEENIKITTPLDIIVAETILKQRKIIEETKRQTQMEKRKKETRN